MPTAQKMHVIGGAGSGKTTLANWLSIEFDFPCFYLDQIGWSEAGKVPLDKRMEKVEHILTNSRWITEGVFLWWTDPLLENADLIVWLDIPFHIVVWRIVKRHIVASWQGNNQHAGIRLLISFVIGVGKQYFKKEPLTPTGPDDDFAITRVATAEILEKYQQKLVHCRKLEDVQRFQTRIKASKF
ncbi:MAG: hypothetical protein DWQ04_30780 [Chloroflexi bacterium]|nr:MAG: hypothetical protein DWQ04_30780 [Chloroflexota bacterium]